MVNYKWQNSNSCGQTIIELLVGLGIAIILAVSLVSANLVVQKAARITRNNTVATKLAQENTEQIRVFRDRRGFGALITNTITGCQKLTNTNDSNVNNWVLTLTDPCTPEQIIVNNVTFSRKILIAAIPLSINKLVTITVTWDDAGGLKTVSDQIILADPLYWQ